MFWRFCRFTPGPDWPAVRELYEAFAQWEDQGHPDADVRFGELAGPIAQLGLELETPDGTRMPVFRRAFVWIRDGEARVRC